MNRRCVVAVLIALAVLGPDAAAAAALDGAALRWPWALPFAGILLTIAAAPLLVPRLWHRHYGKLAFVWGTLTLAPLAALHGTPVAVATLVHATLAEYMFFIILVANVGGALSPLGDPPLFVGFLRGVDFFWTTRELALPTALVAALVLAVFLALDLWFYRKDRRITMVGETAPAVNLSVHGTINLVLMAAIIGAILVASAWKPGIA